MRIDQHRLLRDNDTPVDFRPSPNKGGTIEPRYLVMHYTAGRSAESSIGWLTDPAAKASAHLVVGRDGNIVQLVPFDEVAWHAGKSAWQDGSVRLAGMNRYSIGIELDNAGRLVRQGAHWRSLHLGTTYDAAEVIEAVHKHETRKTGWHVYPMAQLEAAFSLATLLVARYGLRDILGHDDIAPGRKTDPGPAFPMQSLRARVLGRSEEEGGDRFETTAALNVRLGPGTHYAVIPPSPVPPGTRVQVLASEGTWREVDILDTISNVNDLQGWVHGRYLRPVT
jgi:N-acetylmuramoyl-L-alanine amidase